MTASLALSPPVNVRDLGGIPTAHGTLRSGFAIRADDLSTADADTAVRLVDDGLTTIIDLRSDAEVGYTGRGPFGDLPVDYHHLPVLTTLGTRIEGNEVFDRARVEDLYISMFTGAAPRLVTALEVMAASPGSTAFHCSAGKDRTGVLAATLLRLLGADDEQIVADYLRTGPNLPAITARVTPVLSALIAGYGDRVDAAAQAAGRREFSGAAMTGFLSRLSPADTRRHLADAGLSDSLVATLRDRALVTPTAG